MNKDIMKQAGFDKEVKLVEAGKCPMCEKPIDTTTFRDDISLREFKISGMCQKCQDKFFSEGDYQCLLVKDVIVQVKK